MRNNPTLAESAFYKNLQGVYLEFISKQHHFVGRTFAFILDAYLPKIKIGFEIDGKHHQFNPTQIKKDKFRDSYCKTHGIIIHRLTNEQAMNRKECQLICLRAIGADENLIKLAENEDIKKTRLRKKSVNSK